MGQFDDVLSFLAANEDPAEWKMNARVLRSAAAVQELQNRFPGIPEDYTDYLAEVGAGAFRECQFVVYKGFMDPSEIFDSESSASFGKRILCFGDNFSGDPAGFLPDEDWRVVELWHDNCSLHHTNKSFGAFIRDKMLMGSDGTDLGED